MLTSVNVQPVLVMLIASREVEKGDGRLVAETLENFSSAKHMFSFRL